MYPMINLSSLQNGIISPEQRIKAAAMSQQQQSMPVVSDIPYQDVPQEAPPSSIPSAFSQESDYDALDQQDALRRALMAHFSGDQALLPQTYQNTVNRIQSVTNPGPLEQQYNDQLKAAFQQPHVSGLKARLIGLGKGLLMGEGLKGMIQGAADPNTMNLKYRLSQLTPLGQGVGQEEALRQSQLQRGQEFARMSGIDPITGQETPEAAYKKYMASIGYGRLQNQNRGMDLREKNTDSLIEQRKQKYANIPFENFIKAYNSGMLNKNPEGLYAMADRAGIPNPETIEPKVLAGMIKTIVDRAYGVNTLNVQTGEVKSTGITSVEKTKQDEAMKRAKVGASGRPTPEERSQDRALRERNTQAHERSVAGSEQERQQRSVDKARKQAENELPFASADEIDKRTQDILNKNKSLSPSPTQPTATQQTSKPNVQLKSGETLVKQTSNTGKVRWVIRSADGSERVAQ